MNRLDRMRLKYVPSAYGKYLDGSPLLSVFGVKCALLELTGEELTRASILLHLQQLGVSNEAAYEGVSEETLHRLVMKLIQDEEHQQRIRDAFNAVDVCRRGYIEFSDLDKVLSVAVPHMTLENRRALFKSIDAHCMGKVSSRQFYAMLSSS